MITGYTEDQLIALVKNGSMGDAYNAACELLRRYSIKFGK